MLSAKSSQLSRLVFLEAESTVAGVGALPRLILRSGSDDRLLLGVSAPGPKLLSLTVQLKTLGLEGDIDCQLCTETGGWVSSKDKSFMELEPLCAVKFNLTGDVANHYHIWYRSYVDSYGWLDWTKDGGPSGSEGMFCRIQAVELSLKRVDEEAPGAVHIPFFDSSDLSKALSLLEREYPDGSYWNRKGTGVNGSVTKIPGNLNENENDCNSYYGISTGILGYEIGRQCAGFTSMLSDRLYGTEAPARVFSDYSELQVGDQARIYEDNHTVLITEKTDDYVRVAECNADYITCQINWGRKIPREEMWGYYITRRPY